MINIKIEKESARIDVAGKLSELLVETGCILKGIQEAISAQDEQAGAIYKEILVDEGFLREIFSDKTKLKDKEIILGNTKDKKPSKQDLYRALLKEFMEGDE